MSSAGVTREFRTLGWNVHILCGPESDRFAGLFHPPGSNSLTYRDIVNELRLCFDIPINSEAELDERADSWTDIAFGYGDSVGVNLQPLDDDAFPTSMSSSRLISGPCLDEFVSTPQEDPSSDLARLPIARLHAVRHVECGIGRAEPLTAHLRSGCAKHIPYPTLRRDERYLPPNKASGDSRFSRLPYRKTIRPTRGSQSPPKRSASGSVSPTKNIESNVEVADAEDVTDMVAPPTFDIPFEQAHQTMAAFRTSCLAASTKCAVTGKGRSWYMNPSVGPAVQACHIVPQQHYHVYPVPSSFGDSRYSPRRLREAWNRTWSAENGLLLLSHLHEAFDSRLISIHPETHRVRVFMPYDVLLDYHDTVAQLSPIVERRALRHHYQMCCIENMAAKMLMSESFTPEVVPGSAVLGVTSPCETRGRTPIIPSVTSRGNGSPHDPPGDPSKRARKAHGEPAGDTIDFAPDIAPSMVDGSSTSSSFRDELSPPHEMQGMWYILDQTEKHGGKRRRRESESENTNLVYNEESQSKDQHRRPYWDGCITSSNNKEFLADVNWKLGKISGL
ncbi:hypothetical protein H634G_11083 [Metarhizium anisopliae BRIP 53293]|uniref:HNH nuclease domain-containing protein n=1 Tax=Metarhizium anisopliae BRIP 53293 TaxID=1291518 RepID=A0A0D9NM37_METAN|nr:hypothetical protein H634G_11083 [Metarhizium anisopliae BRIP 53293]KJK85591.1 hypothetical protein H633G_10569 [Metarhizium anisopliae BRIP 53284]